MSFIYIIFKNNFFLLLSSSLFIFSTYVVGKFIFIPYKIEYLKKK